VDGRITPLKTEESRTEMPVPAEVVKLLCEWRTTTPYNAPEDWVFASEYFKGKRPLHPNTMLTHIQRVAHDAGLPHITWHSFRHSLTAWGKECLRLDDTKTLLRHANISTTSDVYGKSSELARKKGIQDQLVSHVTKRAGTPSALGVRPSPRSTGAKGSNLGNQIASRRNDYSDPHPTQSPNPAVNGTFSGHGCKPNNQGNLRAFRRSLQTDSKKEGAYTPSVQELSKINDFGQQRMTHESASKQATPDEVTLTDPRLEVRAASVRKARTVNAGIALVHTTVEKMWSEDKKIPEMARAVDLVDANNPRDPYHSFRNLLYRMHKGYRNQDGQIVKLPHRDSDATIRKSVEAGKRAMRSGL
jgi:hypothetical protein